MSYTKRNLRRTAAALLCAVMLPLWGLTAQAADSFDFTLRANGASSATVAVGADVEITLSIESDEDYVFYSMQDYVEFDTDYFVLDEDSISVKKQTAASGAITDIFSAVAMDPYGEGCNRIFINRAALTGIDFAAEEVILTFSLTALQEGTSEITHYRTEMLDENGARMSVNENSAEVTIRAGSSSLTVSTAPTASRITSGSTLSKSTLSGGTVVADDGSVVSGSWAWEDGTEKMSTVGEYIRTAVFTPDDTFYSAVKASITVTVYTTSGGGGGGGGGGGSSGGTSTTTTTEYAVTVESAVNGSAVADSTSAAAGKSVTITTDGHDGYEIDSVSVTDENGNTIALTDNGDGTYTFTMPSSKVTVTVTFAESEKSETGTGGHICPSEKFSDVDTSLWYHEYIDYVLDKGLMVGMSATTFEPNTATTRGMIVTILHRLEGEPAANADSEFTDVAAGEWYTAAIAWAAENGIVLGYGDGTFGPNDVITREQTAAILYRFAAYKGYDTSAVGDISPFNDTDEISEYALQSIKWAVGDGVINGRDDGTIDPRGSTTRAEAAAMLMRFIEKER